MAQASTPSRTRALSINQRILGMKNTFDSWNDSLASVESDNSLTNMWSAIKSLEEAAEQVRKEVIEPELESRINPGERLCGVHLIQSHRKYIEEDTATVIGRAVNRGIDYTTFVSLNASTVASNYPELATVGRNEYTYFR